MHCKLKICYVSMWLHFFCHVQRNKSINLESGIIVVLCLLYFYTI